MALTVKNIIDERVRIILRDIDEGGVQWLDAELLSWFNEACAEVSRIRPEASSDTIDHQLQGGALQTIPDGATLLLEGVCNVVVANGAEGRIVRRVERNTLDNENLNWMTDPPSAEVKRYVVSKTDPRSFYVFPPNNGAGGMRLVVSKAPALVTVEADNVPLPDIYAAPIANYVLFRAFGKQLEDPDSQRRSVEFLNIFNQQMGVTDRNQEQRSAQTRHRVDA